MSDSPQILIANEFHRATVDKICAQFNAHKLWLLSSTEQQELVNELKPVCRAVATACWETSPLIYELPDLEIIACYGVGVDAIDFDITRARNINVTNTPGVLDDAVADLAIALILNLTRNLVVADKFVRDGSWTKEPFPLGKGLAGKTLGILGLGSIGSEVVMRAEPMKLNIAYHNRNPKPVPYPYYASAVELASHSDILLSALPGGAQTDKAVNKKVLEALGSRGLFINVGRGSTVDEVALIEALETGTIAGAGLDVFSNEPEVPEKLRTMTNVVLTPHIGSGTFETRMAMGQSVIDSLMAWRSNEELQSICPQSLVPDKAMN